MSIQNIRTRSEDLCDDELECAVKSSEISLVVILKYSGVVGRVFTTHYVRICWGI